MKILRFDSVGGASGDMILGSLIGLGVDAHALSHSLEALGAGEFTIEVSPFESHGIHGVRASVRLGGHHHGHDHAHEHHHHDHAHAGHDHRGWIEIRDMIEGSTLPQAVKEQSVAVFRRIAEVEARIHGTTMEKIHFHEVGAMDSIVDIVGSCLALHQLDVDQLVVSPLPIGHGTVTCAHGVYPSPTPATLDLLKGLPLVAVDEPFETVTPTGAALLSTWKNADSIPAGSMVKASSYSFGQRKLKGRPNLLRATLLESSESDTTDRCTVLECNIDDSTPEIIGVLTERLFAAGALDVFTAGVQMKKQRPGVLVTVLATAETVDALKDVLFRESTTFGFRAYETERTVLARRWITVNTEWGSIRVKIGTWRGDDVTIAPEMDDCVKAATEHRVPVRKVYDAARRAAGT